MQTQYAKWWSPTLNQDMELKVYGHAGKPVLVFPSMNGRFYEFEDFGMIQSIQSFLEDGKIQVFTVDSIDGQSWTNWNAHPSDRARRHEDYDRYIISEVIPFIIGQNPSGKKILTTGCSMGGYHAINFFFRHPEYFDALIGLSGVARLSLFIGDYMDEVVYINSPVDYLKNLTDEYYLNLYRQSQIILCAGQGDWEQPMIDDMRNLANILTEKNIPHWLDLWGNDVVHDWPWWRQQLPYFLEKLRSNLDQL